MDPLSTQAHNDSELSQFPAQSRSLAPERGGLGPAVPAPSIGLRGSEAGPPVPLERAVNLQVSHCWVALAAPPEVQKLSRREGTSGEVALHQRATELHQHPALGVGLHPLRHCLHAQRSRQPDHGASDLGVDGVCYDTLDEGPIKLHDVDGEPFEVRQ